MVKKQQLIPLGGLTSLFSSSNKQPPHHDKFMSSSSPYSPWQWTSCGLHPRTLSFRQQQQEEEEEDDNDNHTAATMMNSSAAAYSAMDSLSSVDSFSTASDAEAAEAVIRAVRSDRLLFEPDEGASSLRVRAASKPANKLIIKTEEDDTTRSKQAAFGGAMAMSVESRDPYHDFRESMEAMVMSQQQGAVCKDWRWMEEMLGWYLRANGKSTHGLIVNAFVDLLVALSSTATTPAGSNSSATTPEDSPSSPATTPADSSCPATPAATNCCPSSSSDCSCSCSL